MTDRGRTVCAGPRRLPRVIALYGSHLALMCSDPFSANIVPNPGDIRAQFLLQISTVESVSPCNVRVENALTRVTSGGWFDVSGLRACKDRNTRQTGSPRMAPARARSWRCLCPVVPRLLAAEFEMGADHGRRHLRDADLDPGQRSCSSFPTVPMVFVLPTTNGVRPDDPAHPQCHDHGLRGRCQVEPSANDGLHLQNDTATISLPKSARMCCRTARDSPSSVAFHDESFVTPAHLGDFRYGQFRRRPSMHRAGRARADPDDSERGQRPARQLVRAVHGCRHAERDDHGDFPDLAGTRRISRQVRSHQPETDRHPRRWKTQCQYDVHRRRSAPRCNLQSLRTPLNIQRFQSNGCFARTISLSAFAAIPIVVVFDKTPAFGTDGGWNSALQPESAANDRPDRSTRTSTTDAERGHISESAGVVAASVAFHATFDVDLTVLQDGRALQNDPFNGTTNPKSIPDAEVEYTIEVENYGSISPDDDSR